MPPFLDGTDRPALAVVAAMSKTVAAKVSETEAAAK
jgi:hypothetical protein